MSPCILTSLTGLPSMRALPAVGKIIPISSLIVVLFPAPFGPSSPNTSLSCTCSVRPSSEAFLFRWRNPCAYSLLRFSVSIANEGMHLFLQACSLRQRALRGVVRQTTAPNRSALQLQHAKGIKSPSFRAVSPPFAQPRDRPAESRTASPPGGSGDEESLFVSWRFLLPDLHQLARWCGRRRHGRGLQRLRIPPVIQNSHLLHTRNRAPRPAK